MGSTQNSKKIKASKETIYRAFTSPEALAIWLAPNNMTGKVHHFDLRVGGGYQMSLFYLNKEDDESGKTSGNEDKFTTRFIELTPFTRIIQAVIFETDNPAFSEEMIMDVMIEPNGEWTTVTISFRNIPAGIDPKDNEAGTEQSLAKLAHYVEQQTTSL
jgi:uncharacterized protein YndB with AHSA1/START domain